MIGHLAYGKRDVTRKILCKEWAGFFRRVGVFFFFFCGCIDIVGARIFTTPELSHFLARTFCTHTPLLLLGYPNTKKRAYTLYYRLFGLSVFFL
jgi:hypothetical protein